MIQLRNALQINPDERIAIVGSGGKTTTLFQLAYQMAQTMPVLVSVSAHLGVEQIAWADRHLAWQVGEPFPLPGDIPDGVTLITGVEERQRMNGLTETQLAILKENVDRLNVPLLLEADGSRGKPIKAPRENEPPIPEWVTMVIVVCGLSGFGKPITEDYVHRLDRFYALSGRQAGETIRTEDLVRVLSHPQGGLKNIPVSARRVLLFNQADTPELRACAAEMAALLRGSYDLVLTAALDPEKQLRSRNANWLRAGVC